MSDPAAQPLPSIQTPALPSAESALRSFPSWLRFLIPTTLGLAADLAFKAWSFPDGVPVANGPAALSAGRNPAEFQPSWDVIPHVLGFTTTINHGAVFGIGQGMVLFFLAFSLVALAMILWVFITSRKEQWVVHIALGMITAGALGNLYDRAIHAGVRDMLRFYVNWYPYIFNIADVLLCIGVPLLLLCWMSPQRKYR